MKTISVKNTITALLIVAVTISISSCKKYLESEPLSGVTPDFAFGTIDNATNTLYAAYVYMAGDQGYGNRLSGVFPFDTDESMNTKGRDDNGARDIGRYNIQTSNTQLGPVFAQGYQGVERANICIYYIPRMTQFTSGSADEQKATKRLYGEALTLRAQYLFELVRNWGDIPVHWLPSSFEPDVYIPKTDRDTIYERILNDLAVAIPLLPWRTEAGVTNERITQGAARALRARIALFRGGYSLRQNGQVQRGNDHLKYYQIAREECNAIMLRTDQHKLNPSYKSVWRDYVCAHGWEPNGEILFEVAMAGGGQTDSKFGYYNGPRYNNIGNSAITILPTAFYQFDSTDTRRDVSCAPYNINTNYTLTGQTSSNIFDGKFRKDWTQNPSYLTAPSTTQTYGINWPVIRFSDVLLMFAEAENEINNGPTAAAKAAFEQVRLRAYGGDGTLIGTTPTGYANFFNAIVKERLLEFMGEAIRKYDLLRWNLLGQKLTETKAALTAMAARQAPYNTLPEFIYLKNTSATNPATFTTTLEYGNSLYKPDPYGGTAPTGYTKINWVHSSIQTGILTTGTPPMPNYAFGFQTGKSELMPFPIGALDANPNLKQNPGY